MEQMPILNVLLFCCRETEKAAVVRGRRQRFKPNVVGASGKREAPVQGEGKDKNPQEPEGAIEKVQNKTTWKR